MCDAMQEVTWKVIKNEAKRLGWKYNEIGQRGDVKYIERKDGLRIIVRKMRIRWLIDIVNSDYSEESIVIDTEKNAIRNMMKLLLMYEFVIE